MPFGFGAPILHSETSRIFWLTLISLFLSRSLVFISGWMLTFFLLSSHQLYCWSSLKNEIGSTVNYCVENEHQHQQCCSLTRCCFQRDENILASIKCRAEEEARIGYTDARNSSFCFFFISSFWLSRLTSFIFSASCAVLCCFSCVCCSFHLKLLRSDRLMHLVANVV